MDVDGTVIVSGIPGSGKTTIARRLAERFSRSVHIEGDVVGHDFIVSGLVPPEARHRRKLTVNWPYADATPHCSPTPSPGKASSPWWMMSWSRRTSSTVT